MTRRESKKDTLAKAQNICLACVRNNKKIWIAEENTFRENMHKRFVCECVVCVCVCVCPVCVCIARENVAVTCPPFSFWHNVVVCYCIVCCRACASSFIRSCRLSLVFVQFLVFFHNFSTDKCNDRLQVAPKRQLKD